ncbi:hypothetical protein [Maridesulfovibrio sp.]|uniref:hypothetical protein n=1 Tax=Maridesulfovibrio sp. TaxID=2795000 RepID=UPI0039F0E1E4
MEVISIRNGCPIPTESGAFSDIISEVEACEIAAISKKNIVSMIGRIEWGWIVIVNLIVEIELCLCELDYNVFSGV